MTSESSEITVERSCSCELSVNAKGDVSYKVKAYEESLLMAIENAFAGKLLVEQKLKELKEKASPQYKEYNGPASQ